MYVCAQVDAYVSYMNPTGTWIEPSASPFIVTQIELKEIKSYIEI